MTCQYGRTQTGCNIGCERGCRVLDKIMRRIIQWKTAEWLPFIKGTFYFSASVKKTDNEKKKKSQPPKMSAFQIKCVDLPQIQHMLFSGKSFLRMKHFLLCENWNLLWPHEIDEFNEFCWSFLWRVTFLFFFWFFPPWNLMWVNYLESQSVQNDWATQHSGYFFFF